MLPLTPEQSDRAASCFPLAMQIAGRFAVRFPSVGLDEFSGEADDSLTRAAATFDPSRGLQFTTLAHCAVRRALARLASQRTERAMVTMPSSQADQHPLPERDPTTDADYRQHKRIREILTNGRAIVGGPDWRLLLGHAAGRTLEDLGRRRGITKERARQREKEAAAKIRAVIG